MLRCTTGSSGSLPLPAKTAPHHSTRRLYLASRQRYHPAEFSNIGAPDDRRIPFSPRLLPNLRTISSRRNRRAPPAESLPIGCAAIQSDALGAHPPELQRKSLRPLAQSSRRPSGLRLHLQPLPRRSLPPG